MAPYVLTNEDCPPTLRDLCLSYCVKNTQTFSEYDSSSGKYSLKDGVSLPPEICESLVDAYIATGRILDDNFMHIFKDHMRTHLRQINVQDSNVTETALQWLIPHKPTELNISGIKDVGRRTLDSINQYGKQMARFSVGDSLDIFQDLHIKKPTTGHESPSQGDADTRVLGADYVFCCPELRAFSVHSLDKEKCKAHDIIAVTVQPFQKLTFLDLSSCNIDIQAVDCLGQLRSLNSLILYNVPLNDIQAAFQQIGTLKTLRYKNSVSYLIDYKLYSPSENRLLKIVECNVI